MELQTLSFLLQTNLIHGNNNGTAVHVTVTINYYMPACTYNAGEIVVSYVSKPYAD